MKPQRSTSAVNPADRVLRARLRERIHFPDLSERRALKLSALSHYTARAHFGMWHRRLGGPDFSDRSGIFTPLFSVELETMDVPLTPQVVLDVRGETYLGKTLTPAGAVDHLVREGHYRLLIHDADGSEQVVGRVHLMNVFTRYDPDPARRRVTALPAHMGLGAAPSRLSELPTLETLLPTERTPDFHEADTRAWHYGQTDPNHHVSGMEYLRMMECYIAEELHRRSYDMRRLYFSRARIVYRKPCFRGEGYRRIGWVRSTEPLVIAGAFLKASESPDARPAVAVELAVSQHDRE